MFNRNDALALMLSMKTMNGLARERVLRTIKDEYLFAMDTALALYPDDPLYVFVMEEVNRRQNED